MIGMLDNSERKSWSDDFAWSSRTSKLGKRSGSRFKIPLEISQQNVRDRSLWPFFSESILKFDSHKWLFWSTVRTFKLLHKASCSQTLLSSGQGCNNLSDGYSSSIFCSATGRDNSKFCILPLRDSDMSWGIDTEVIISRIESAKIRLTGRYFMRSVCSSKAILSPISHVSSNKMVSMIRMVHTEVNSNIVFHSSWDSIASEYAFSRVQRLEPWALPEPSDQLRFKTSWFATSSRSICWRYLVN